MLAASTDVDLFISLLQVHFERYRGINFYFKQTHPREQRTHCAFNSLPTSVEGLSILNIDNKYIDRYMLELTPRGRRATEDCLVRGASRRRRSSRVTWRRKSAWNTEPRARHRQSTSVGSVGARHPCETYRVCYVLEDRSIKPVDEPLIRTLCEIAYHVVSRLRIKSHSIGVGLRRSVT